MTRGAFLRHLSLLTLVIFSLRTEPLSAGSLPGTITLDGRLYDSTVLTDPLLNPSVQFKVQILSKDLSCVLYEETQTWPTDTSDGYFNLKVGSPLADAKRSGDDPGNVFAAVFQNSKDLLGGGAGCTSPHSPASGDERYVRITVTPSGHSAEVMDPILLDSVPNAMVAESVQGLGPSDLLQAKDDASTDLTQATLESIFSSTNLPLLNALLAGTSTQYMAKSTAAGAALPVYSGNPSTSTAGSIWYDSATNTIKFNNGTVTPQTLGTAGAGISSVSVTSDLTADGVAGDTLSGPGTIGLANSGVTAGEYTKVTVDAKGRVTAGDVLDNADIPSALSVTSVSATTGNFRTLRLTNATSQYLEIVPPASITGTPVFTWPGTAGSANQVLQTNGSGTLGWTFLSMADIRSTVTPGNTIFPVTPCAANKSLHWSVLTDTFDCQDIDDLDGAMITTGTIDAARLPNTVALVGGNTVTATMDVGTNAAYNLNLETDSTPRLTVTAIGNVGIGTTSPQASMSVNKIGANLTSFPTATASVSDATLFIRRTVTTPAQNDYGAMIGFGDQFGTEHLGAGIAIKQTSADDDQTGLAFLVHPNTTTNSGLSEAMLIDHTGNVGIGTASPAISLVAGRTYLTIKGQTASGALELSQTAADASGVPVGVIQFSDANTTGTEKRSALIGSTTSGATANDRGGLLYFATKGDGGSLGNRMFITNTGTIVVGNGAATQSSNIIPNQDVSALNPGTTASATIFEGPSSSHLIFDLKNNDSADSIAFRHSAANSGTVDRIGMVMKGDGNIGIGTTSPTAVLHLNAGTAAAGTSPLKFTPGTVLSTPEDGTMEFDGTNFYLTAGGTRRSIAASSSGTLTNVSTISNASGGISLSPSTGNSVQITGGTTSTSSTSGALIVTGGAGISENLNVGGNVTANGNIAAATTTAATGGANANSPSIYLTANYWTGAASAADRWSIANILGTGANPTSTLTFDHPTGTSGAKQYAFLSGNVGIGTTSPSNILEVSAAGPSVYASSSSGAASPFTATDPVLRIRNTTSTLGTGSFLAFSSLSGGATNASTYIGSFAESSGATAGNIVFGSRTGSTAYQEFMRISPSGSLGIGTTAPSKLLEVQGSGDMLVSFRRTDDDNTRADILQLRRTRSSSTSPSSGFGSNLVFRAEGFTNGNDATQARIGAAWENNQTNDTTDRDASLLFLTAADDTITERMRISSAGKVGIGTTSPTERLDVRGTLNSATSEIFAKFARPDDAVNFTIQNAVNGGNGITVGPVTAHPLAIQTGATERMRIDSSGKVGIGTTSPTYLLELDGTTTITGTVSGPSFSTAVTGTGTAFLTEVSVGDKLLIANTVYTVSAVSSDTSLTTSSVHPSFTDVTATKILNLIKAKNFSVNSRGFVGIGTSPSNSYSIDILNDVSAAMATRHNSTTGESQYVALSDTGSVVLSAFGSATGGTLIGQTKSGNNFLHSTSRPLTVGTQGAYPLNLAAGNALRMTILNTGNVGVGTTDPGYKLDVQGGDINASGSVRAAGVALTSDLRYKRDIEPLDHALDKILNIRGVSYRWRVQEFPHKHFNDRPQVGVIAQEVEAQFPEVVDTNQDGYKSVNYPALIAPIIEAMRTLYGRLTDTEAELTTQDRRIASVEAHKADKAVVDAKVQRLEAENAKLKADAEKQMQENAKMKARLDKIEKMLNSK